MSDSLKGRRGRPPLSESSPSVKVNFFLPKSLHAKIKARSHDLKVADSDVLRGCLEAYLPYFGSDRELPDRVTFYLEETELGKAVARAAEAWGMDNNSIVKMALIKGLALITSEGEELVRKLTQKTTK